MASTVLRNYHRVLKLCETLEQTNLLTIPDDELEASLELLKENAIQLPIGMQKTLVKRRCEKLLKDCAYCELLVATNPFLEDGPFDMLQPALSGIAVPTSSKVSTWADVIFKTVLLGLIAEGELASAKVRDFCLLALKALSEVSAMDLEAGVAREFGEEKCIFRACLALLCPTWDVEGQVAA